MDPNGDRSPRILLVSALDPRTHRGGMGTVTRSFMRLLQREPFNATLELASSHHPLEHFHRIRQLTSLVISLVTRLPAKAAFMFSRRLQRALQQRLREQEFDLILINLTDLLWLLPVLPANVPRLLLAHNIEHHLYGSQIRALGPTFPLLRGVLRRDWQRLHQFEMSGLRRIQNVIFLSHYDAETARRECPDLNALVVPPVFDEPPVARSRPTPASGELRIGFLGNFDWWPNREGLRWFLTRVFPHAGDHVRLHVFGQNSRRLTPRHPRIVAHGFVLEKRDIWSNCDFMICPIFSGGGVPIKLAETIYQRVPVLTTSFAARGLQLEHDPAIERMDHPKDWIGFLRSPAARTLASLTISGQLAEQFHSDRHAERVHRFISELCRSRDERQGEEN